MGAPIFNWDQIGFNPQFSILVSEVNQFQKRRLQIEQKGQKNFDFDFCVVSMGNPHAVSLVDDIDNFSLEKIGPIV